MSLQKMLSIKSINFSSSRTLRFFANCWKCNKDFQSIPLQCKKCGSLQHPDSSIKKHNFFALFQISQTYLVDKKLIDSRCKDFQKKYHPDRFSSQEIEPQLKGYANGFSVYLNEARQVLLNDMKRMAYLLEIKGYPLQDIDHNTGVDSKFIAEIFEMQEEMETTESIAHLDELKSNIQQRQKELQKLFCQFYEHEDYEQGRKVALKHKYYDTTLQAIAKRKAVLVLQSEISQHSHSSSI